MWAQRELQQQSWLPAGSDTPEVCALLSPPALRHEEKVGPIPGAASLGSRAGMRGGGRRAGRDKALGGLGPILPWHRSSTSSLGSLPLLSLPALVSLLEQTQLSRDRGPEWASLPCPAPAMNRCTQGQERGGLPDPSDEENPELSQPCRSSSSAPSSARSLLMQPCMANCSQIHDKPQSSQLRLLWKLTHKMIIPQFIVKGLI